MNECVFIYRTYHIVSQGGLQFYLSEIGRQLVKAPLAAAISPYLAAVISPYLISPTHPTQSLSETAQNLGRSFKLYFLAHSVVAVPGYIKNTKLQYTHQIVALRRVWENKSEISNVPSV